MTYSHEIDLPMQAGSELDVVIDGVRVRRSVLGGGVRVLTEEIPSYRSTSIGFWIGAGSRDEVAGTYGSTHFLEHLLFKGTTRRSSQEIAEYSDYLGGSFNAGTSKQTTSYYGHVFDEDVPAAIELLADMVTSASLTADDMDMERGVILEELAMYNDDASDVASEHIPQLVFADNHPFARPVGGTRESVRALQHESLVKHYRENYVPSELVVTAAGALSHEEICARVMENLAAYGWDVSEGVNPAPRRTVHDITYSGGRDAFIERHVEQAAVIVGMPGPRLGDERRATLVALQAILGGGSSSRLFQEVREKRGLAYTTYAYPASYREGGMFALYAGCAPENAREVARLLEECLEDIADKGVTSDEVESAFRRVRADIVFDRERLSARMNRLATNEIIRGTIRPPELMIAQVRQVQARDVQALARELASGARSRVIVGPHE